LDTNLKDNMPNSKSRSGRKITSTTIGTLLIILVLTAVSVGIYAPIKDYAFKYDAKEYIESNSFVYTLSHLTRYLIKIENENGYNPRYEGLKNIKYYIKSDNKGLVASNITDDSLEEEIKNSRFYLRVKTDEEGNPTIVSAPNSFNKNAFVTDWSRGEDKKDFAGLDIVYTIPKMLRGNDLLTHDIKGYHIEQYMILLFVIGGISIIILIILAFSPVYSSQIQAAIIKIYNKIYLELKLLIWVGFFLAAFLLINFVSMNSYNYGSNYIEIIHDANWYFYVIGIPVTFILYSLIYLSLVYIKHVYHVGFKEGVIKSSLFGKLAVYIIHSIKKIADDLIDTNITKEYHKKLLMLLGINLLAIYIIAATGALGWVLALAYTIFLFNYSLKVLDKVRALNEASGLLAKGNFDIVLSEDIGVLSPFSRSLNNIKDGFKIAVEEEIKSQNMKTLLISNVSHDLKTPLTSIITYVDLLKNEDIDEKAQREYIDILDKKSKRLKVLIDDLFEASKASSGNIEIHLERVDIIALLRQTLGEMEEKINDSTLQMRINLPENKAICNLDGRRAYRVFENIISNILKYAMPNTRVYIDVEEKEKDISFIFKNISSYEMNFDSSEIMERFTRGDKSRSTEGSGLGLAIAKSLVELQKGSLDIKIDGDLFKLIVTFPKA
jgi:signal transduction histidine kinase